MSIFPGWENPFFKIETLRSHAKERVKKTVRRKGFEPQNSYETSP